MPHSTGTAPPRPSHIDGHFLDPRRIGLEGILKRGRDVHIACEQVHGAKRQDAERFLAFQHMFGTAFDGTIAATNQHGMLATRRFTQAFRQVIRRHEFKPVKRQAAGFYRLLDASRPVFPAVPDRSFINRW